MKNFLILNFIIPFVMILLGVILNKYPNPKIGHNGYSTPSSRESQERWDYAQQYAPKVFLKSGIYLLIIILILNTIFSLLNMEGSGPTFIGNIIGFISLAVSFYKVEKTIKIKFDT